MRYKEGELPNPDYSHTEGMHVLLMFSVVLALLVGVVLFFMGRRGNVLWLQAWSAGLIVCSLLYIANAWLNFI